MQTNPNPRRNLFWSDEHGGMTLFWMFGIVILAMLAGLAIDVTNLHRHKERLTLAADAAAQVGILALAQGKSATQVQAAVLASVALNAPAKTVGPTMNPKDVQLVRFDPKSRTLIAGTPNAVKVTLHNDSTVNNPVRTTLLQMAGVETFEVDVTTVAYYGQPGNCTSSDMIYGKLQVTLTSGNLIGPSYCVHSQTAVWLPQQNTFQKGSGVSMPNLIACKAKCVNTANPGIEDAVFAMNLNLPKVSDHINGVTTDMMATTSTLKTSFFSDKTLATNLKPLVDAKIMNTAASKKLTKGSSSPSRRTSTTT
jgi:Flp pilus assembly protein TadG